MREIVYNINMSSDVSVIIPTFNEKEYLPKLLTALDAQTVHPLEIIVADNFSTDKTREIARKYGCIVVDGGLPPVARNKGGAVAKGEILLFLDSDVVPPPQFLEKATAEMEEKKFDVATCFMDPITTNKIDRMMHTFSNYYMRLMQPIYPHACGFCIFATKTMHEKIGGFDETLALAEDHDYAQRASKVGKFGYLTSCKIPVSIRRLSEEGRWKLALKYMAVEFHMLFLGKIKKGMFDYDFGKHSGK